LTSALATCHALPDGSTRWQLSENFSLIAMIVVLALSLLFLAQQITQYQ
jgi:hypothetical protein